MRMICQWAARLIRVKLWWVETRIGLAFGMCAGQFHARNSDMKLPQRQVSGPRSARVRTIRGGSTLAAASTPITSPSATPSRARAIASAQRSSGSGPLRP